MGSEMCIRDSRERDVIWLDKQAYDYQDAKILEDMITILKEKTIIN